MTGGTAHPPLLPDLLSFALLTHYPWLPQLLRPFGIRGTLLRPLHPLRTVSPWQVHSTQRNVAANAQRKFVTTYCMPAGFEGGPLPGTPPVELIGVLMMSVSPSGAS